MAQGIWEHFFNSFHPADPLTIWSLKTGEHSKIRDYPAGPFPILEPQLKPEIGQFYSVCQSRSTELRLKKCEMVGRVFSAENPNKISFENTFR